MLCNVILVVNDRGQTFPVDFLWVCTAVAILVHCLKRCGILGCCWTFKSLHRFSIGLSCRAWLDHSKTLKCFYVATHLLLDQGVWDHCQNYNPTSMITLIEGGFAQTFTIHFPIAPFLNTDWSSCPLCRKAAPKHDDSTSMLHT